MKYRLFRQDLVDRRNVSGVAILVKYTIPAVHNRLPFISDNNVLAYDFGPPNSLLNFLCTDQSPVGKSQTDSLCL